MTNILHILTRPLDDVDQTLISAWENQGKNRMFELSPDAPDYDRLVDLIFEADIAITW